MKTLLKFLAGTATGGGFGYGFSDGLDPLVPFIFFLAAAVFLGGLMMMALERVDAGE